MIVENYQSIGVLSRLHGVHGEALFIAGNKLSKDFNKTEWVFIIVDGLPVPFFISEIRIKTESTALLKLEGIEKAEDMDEFIGLEVCLPSKKLRKSKEKALPGDIKGYKVIDEKHGEIGIAEAVINYQENYLLQIFNNKKEILVPIAEDILKEIDDKKKCIFINAPEGLIELYL
jgi:16S rRNA processing protein RimM